MAQKMRTLLVDNLDGSEAEATVRFGLGDARYEVDLNAVHAKELRESLAPYVERARTVPGTWKPAGRSRRGPSTGAADCAAVREWARENGVKVKDRGKLSNEVVALYRAATGN